MRLFVSSDSGFDLTTCVGQLAFENLTSVRSPGQLLVTFERALDVRERFLEI